MKGFLINLDESIARLDAFEKQLLELGFSRVSEDPLVWRCGSVVLERLSAVDGRVLNKREKEDLLEKGGYFWDWIAHDMTGGEIGCFLSHRKFWQRVVSSDSEFCFVLEDDMQLSPDILSFLEEDDWIPENTDFVKMDFSPSNKRNLFPVSKPVNMKNKRKIVRAAGRLYGTGCYIIRRSAAKRCLEESKHLKLPVDLFLFDHRFRFAPQNVLYCVFPALALDNGTATAVIGGTRNDSHVSLGEHILKGFFSAARKIRLRYFMRQYSLRWEEERYLH